MTGLFSNLVCYSNETSVYAFQLKKGCLKLEHSRYLTVKALTKYIKRKFDFDPHLNEIYVKGEISNYKRHSSGHVYFTLKDDASRISAIMFAKTANQLPFQPEEGMNILVKGKITVYESSGQYQIYVDHMEPDGIGALYLAYEQLKEKLSGEGLFDQSIKKSLPKYPATVGVVTSPTGAAVRDIITTIKRRYPLAKILLFPTLVQGKNAAPSIVQSIQKANAHQLVDVLIVGRGGGSIEDLWAFNEEMVARAIFESNIPIISAVGHETDITIADFVADDRAPTPTAAAEMAVPDKNELLEMLLFKKNRLYRETLRITKQGKERLDAVMNTYVMRNPSNLYIQKWEQLDRATEALHIAQTRLIRTREEKLQPFGRDVLKKLTERTVQTNQDRLHILQKQLFQGMNHLIAKNEHRFHEKMASLDALSPLNTLKRGFSVTYDDGGQVIHSIEQVKKNQKIEVRVMDGKINCIVDQTEKGEKHD